MPRKIQEIAAILQNGSPFNLTQLRQLSWSGLNETVRSVVWRLLFKYVPFNCTDQSKYLQKKRQEYKTELDKLLGDSCSCFDDSIWHQIHIDVLRTNPDSPQFTNQSVKNGMERILYIWAIRHPASGYVQGMNDVIVPIFEVFLNEQFAANGDKIESHVNEQNDAAENSRHDALLNAEADSYWCFCKLLSKLQDNYTSGQNGIFKKTDRLKEIVAKVDTKLIEHFDREGISLMSFSFRWINCLLVREFPLRTVLRMWDSYLSESEDASSFDDFHLYVCAAILIKWSDMLKKLDFQECIMWLQKMPTEKFTELDVEILMSEAYVLKSLYSVD